MEILLLLHTVMQITIRVHPKIKANFHSSEIMLKDDDFPIPYHTKYNCWYLKNMPGN